MSDAVTTDPATEGELSRVSALVEVYAQIDLPQQLRALLERAAAWSGATAGLAIGASEERGKLGLVASTLPQDDPRPAAVGHIDEELVLTAVGYEPALHSGATPLERLAVEWPASPAACGVLPVLDSTVAWRGVLLLVFDAAPSSDDWHRVVAFVEAARPAVTNAVRVARLRELVIKDDTAHCYNRRYFEEFLPEELARASRFRAPLSLIFLDMDNLKEVNNRHGHDVGSRTLTEVAERVRRKIRKFDKLFRFGGDEFCILLPETEWHGAMEVAERVRDAVASRPFLAEEPGLDGGIHMTASLGIAAYPLHARSQRDLVQRADRAMQRIKRGQKNSISVAEIVEEPEHAG